ncbi:MAG: hypothetical protein NT069_23900, partial [Planctomycetota bacterium]|nr:hypothetical protein [Planctomycetota bacterium]
MTTDSNLPAEAPRRSAWKRNALFVAMGLFALIAAGPTIVAWSPLRHDLPRTRMRGFTGKIEVGSASLAWFGPAVLRDVRFFDQDGEPFLTVESTQDDRSIVSRLLHPNQRPRLYTSKPVITLRLRADGSNLQDALLPVLEYEGKRARKPVEFESVGGVLKILDTVTGRSAEWNDIRLAILNPPGKDTEHTLELTSHPANGSADDGLNVNATWQEPRPGDPLSADVTIRGNGLPLESAVPFLIRLLPETWLKDVSLTGMGDCSLKLHVVRDTGGTITGSVQGRMGAANLALGLPALLGTDRISLAESTVDLSIDLEEHLVRVRTLEAKSPLGVWSANGAMSLIGGPRPHGEPMTILGNIDLAQLTQMLPETVSLPAKTELLAGDLKVELRATPEEVGERVVWRAAVGAPRIEARVDGEPVVWESPIDVDLAIQQQRDRVVVDSLKITTPVFTLIGNPDGDSLRLSGSGDVGELATRFGMAGEPKRSDFAGKLEVTGQLRQPQDGEITLNSQILVRDLEYRRLVSRLVERPRSAALLDEAGRDESRDGDRSGGNLPQTFREENAPPPAPVRPRPEAPLDRRAKRAQAKAERADRRDARKEAAKAAQAKRIAEREASATEWVREEGWETMWSDPQLTLTGDYRMDFGNRTVTIDTVSAETAGLRLNASGTITKLLSTNRVDITGNLVTTLEDLVTHLAGVSRGPVRFAGEQRFEIEFHGPLAEIEGDITGGWRQANAFGLSAGPVTLQTHFAKGVAALTPAEMDLSGGRMFFSGNLDLNERPPVFARGAGPVMTDVELTQEVCNGWLQFVAPILSQATRAEGR